MPLHGLSGTASERPRSPRTCSPAALSCRLLACRMLSAGSLLPAASVRYAARRPLNRMHARQLCGPACRDVLLLHGAHVARGRCAAYGRITARQLRAVQVAGELGMRCKLASKGADVAQVAQEVGAFCADHMPAAQQDVLPSLMQMRAAGAHDLARRYRLVDRQEVARRLGRRLRGRGRPRNVNSASLAHRPTQSACTAPVACMCPSAIWRTGTHGTLHKDTHGTLRSGTFAATPVTMRQPRLLVRPRGALVVLRL
jgi:hypothetical protein